jgi:hypothetical protein
MIMFGIIMMIVQPRRENLFSRESLNERKEESVQTLMLLYNESRTTPVSFIYFPTAGILYTTRVNGETYKMRKR